MGILQFRFSSWEDKQKCAVLRELENDGKIRENKPNEFWQNYDVLPGCKIEDLPEWVALSVSREWNRQHKVPSTVDEFAKIQEEKREIEKLYKGLKERLEAVAERYEVSELTGHNYVVSVSRNIRKPTVKLYDLVLEFGWGILEKLDVEVSTSKLEGFDIPEHMLIPGNRWLAFKARKREDSE